jgi:hypothetical protein
MTTDLPPSFALEVDAAQALAHAADAARRGGEPGLADEVRPEILAHLERALAADPSRAVRVVKAIDDCELAGEPEFAALRERASAPR